MRITFNSKYLFYFLLIALTLTSYFLAETETRINELAFLVLPIAGVKFYMIFHNFMEMKSSNLVWKLTIITLLILIILPISILLT